MILRSLCWASPTNNERSPWRYQKITGGPGWPNSTMFEDKVSEKTLAKMVTSPEIVLAPICPFTRATFARWCLLVLLFRPFLQRPSPNSSPISENKVNLHESGWVRIFFIALRWFPLLPLPHTHARTYTHSFSSLKINAEHVRKKKAVRTRGKSVRVGFVPETHSLTCTHTHTSVSWSLTLVLHQTSVCEVRLCCWNLEKLYCSAVAGKWGE